MCRIAAVVRLTGGVSEREKQALLKASHEMRKGGPDNAGIEYINDKVGLLHRRLSIIDTSESANQPMSDKSKKHFLIFNGELFNFRMLAETKLDSINLITQSDSEVLLQLLINYGTACIPWLNGFFSFVYYAADTNYTIAARDRLGKKPFLYYYDSERFVCASEMKGILQFDIPREISRASAFQFVKFSFIPSPSTIFTNIHKLRQGHYLEIKNDEVSTTPYYSVTDTSASHVANQPSYDEAKVQLQNLVSASVQARMISDVPVGAFLSGGIDSSIVVSQAQKYTKQLLTFSIGFPDDAVYDETKYATLVAKKYNTAHEVFTLTEQDYVDAIEQVLDSIDEPFGDSSCIPMYILCKKVKPHITVALSGDGGDEIFSGYNRHKAEYAYRYQKYKFDLAKLAQPLLSILPNNKESKIGNLTRKLKKFTDNYSSNSATRYLNLSSFTSNAVLDNLFAKDFLEQLKSTSDLPDSYQRITSNLAATSNFNEYLLSDSQFVLVGDMLHKVDMMSMANALEVRSPLLDHSIVDYAFSLPAQYKITSTRMKMLLTDAFREELPHELFNRPKSGFEIPLLKFFRTTMEAYIFEELLSKKQLAKHNYFNHGYVNELRAKLHSRNSEMVYSTIWSLVVFQRWWDKWMG
jgi:asparagine synthase (glutamine-hydrolysing)